jgi:hypothetical protein
MRTAKALLFIILCPALLYAQTTDIKHFIYFAQERENIHNDTFLSNPGIAGAQIAYAWRRLEPGKDQYDFSEIEDDLNFLHTKGKNLFIMIKDVTFVEKYAAVPAYMITDTTYHGGQERQCVVRENGTESCHGWYARRWDPKVTERFHKLLQKLAEKFDGKIEGIALAETAIDISEKHPPAGFSNDTYLAGIKGYMKASREYFKQSVPILYVNFMPGGVSYLKSLYDYAREVKVGMGGPDIKVYKPFQMKNSYPLIRELAGVVPTGVAVQEGNYDEISGKTGKKVTVPDILDFSQSYLRLNYVFWCTEEPYYSRDVMPLLRKR